MEGVLNYGGNGAQVQLQIFLLSTARYAPKLGFSDIFLFNKECALYTSVRYTRHITVVVDDVIVLVLYIVLLLPVKIMILSELNKYFNGSECSPDLNILRSIN